MPGENDLWRTEQMKLRLSLAMVLTLLATLLSAPALLAQTSEIHYHGLIESRPTSGLIGEWHVSGHVIHVTSATVVNQDHGQAVIGATVDVYGTSQADGFTTTRVEAAASSTSATVASFRGALESLPTAGLVRDSPFAGP